MDKIWYVSLFERFFEDVHRLVMQVPIVDAAGLLVLPGFVDTTST